MLLGRCHAELSVKEERGLEVNTEVSDGLTMGPVSGD